MHVMPNVLYININIFTYTVIKIIDANGQIERYMDPTTCRAIA